VTPAIAAALVVLAASFALSVAFVLANGGLDLPAEQRSTSSPGATGSGAVAEASPSGSAGADPGETTSSGGPAPSSGVSTVTPSASPAATTPRPTTRSTPRPSSSRYALLTACPGKPDCWIYVVRGGDNLFSIAKYFGVSLDVVEARNPWTKTTALVAGQKLQLPPPTR
jgi:LysM repeat protein